MVLAQPGINDQTSAEVEDRLSSNLMLSMKRDHSEFREARDFIGHMKGAAECNGGGG